MRVEERYDVDPIGGPLMELIEGWCDRRDLRHLALVLPAFVANNGLTDGWAGVLQALYDVRATRLLPDAEQRVIEMLVPVVEKVVYRR